MHFPASPPSATVSGIILAGGQSRRMGRDKAHLPLPGNTEVSFVEHLASLLKACCQEVILVARDMTLAAQYALPDVRIITDKIADVGPLMGLYSGLRAISTSHALVVAVDMPFVRPEMLSFLLTQPRADELLIPVVDDIPQVLCGMYPRSILPVIEQCLSEGRRDPRSLLEGVPVRYINEAELRQVDPELRSFINVNTPEELRKWNA